VSFGLLAVIPLRAFRELAVTMTVGIVLDAVVVRSLLVPTLLTLVGPVSGWPGPNLRADRRRRRPGGALPDVTASVPGDTPTAVVHQVNPEGPVS
ncbi:MAG: MMPL family transporter, partial [Pedococcus sp.]